MIHEVAYFYRYSPIFINERKSRGIAVEENRKNPRIGPLFFQVSTIRGFSSCRLEGLSLQIKVMVITNRL